MVRSRSKRGAAKVPHAPALRHVQMASEGRRMQEQMQECTNGQCSQAVAVCSAVSQEEHVYLDPMDGSELTWREAEMLGVTACVRRVRATAPADACGKSSGSRPAAHPTAKEQKPRDTAVSEAPAAEGRRIEEQMSECTNDITSAEKPSQELRLVYLDPFDGSEISWREAEALGVQGVLPERASEAEENSLGAQSGPAFFRMDTEGDDFKMEVIHEEQQRRHVEELRSEQESEQAACGAAQELQESKRMLSETAAASHKEQQQRHVEELCSELESEQAACGAAQELQEAVSTTDVANSHPADEAAGPCTTVKEATPDKVAPDGGAQACVEEETSQQAIVSLDADDGNRSLAKNFAVGDIVALSSSWGVPREFHGKIAIISEAKPTHCTVLLLNDDYSKGVAELWPAYHDLEPINSLCRVGSRIACDGISPGPGAYLNGLAATVQEHPRDGHPQWPDAKGQAHKGGRLFVFVVPDDKKKRPMSVPIRYLRPYEEMVIQEKLLSEAKLKDADWHVGELLRIASAVSSAA